MMVALYACVSTAKSTIIYDYRVRGDHDRYDQEYGLS